jgi:hypothetical protein
MPFVDPEYEEQQCGNQQRGNDHGVSERMLFRRPFSGTVPGCVLIVLIEVFCHLGTSFSGFYYTAFSRGVSILTDKLRRRGRAVARALRIG